MSLSAGLNLQSLMNSRRAGAWAFRLARILPPGAGFRLADFIAGRLAASKSTPMIQAVRANQWVVNGEQMSSVQLDQAVRESMGYVTRSFYCLFHQMYDPGALRAEVVLNPQVQALIEGSARKERGVMVVGLHFSAFDLVMRATMAYGLHATALSLPDPNAAVEWQHGFRRQAGFEILPASLANLREAIRRLQDNEIVVTGIDRPVSDLKLKPRFFGRPACLPTHHVHLAMQAGVPVQVMVPVWEEDGLCHILSSDYLDMHNGPDRQQAILANAEMILEVAAAFIRQYPRQWVVYQPVWPEVLAGIP